MNAVQRERSRGALAMVLLWRRQRALAAVEQNIENIARVIFASQAFDVVRAVYAADLSGSEAAVTASLRRAIVAALAFREPADAVALAKGYEDAIYAALGRVDARFGVSITLADVKAAEWIATHSRQTMRGLNETTTTRLTNSLAAQLPRSRAPLELATTGALTIATTTDKRAPSIGSTEALFGYGYGDLAAAGLFSRAGVRMLKEWYHTDGCPCPICTDNDGAVVPVSEPFPAGEMGPPAHPNCGCFCDIYPDFANLAAPLVILGQNPNFNRQAA